MNNDRLSDVRWATIVLATVCLVAFVSSTAHAGGVAIVQTVLSDDGDGDGYADTNETVNVQLLLRNTSGIDLTDVSIELIALDPDRICATTTTIDVGDLAAGEERLTDEAFVFSVLAGIDRGAALLGPLDDLSASFGLIVSSEPEDQPAIPFGFTIDLDLDVADGAGPTMFFESFEEETLGAFEVENLDQGKASLAQSDGWRCQYHDPDWVNSNNYGDVTGPDCFLANSNAHGDVVHWNLSGPSFSPLLGRGFSGFHSLFFGNDLGPPQNWTTPMSAMEAVRSSDPIHLGWDAVSPTLTFKQMISFVDSRSINSPEGRAPDRGVVLAQLADEFDNPVGPWIKIYAHQNAYDQIASDNFFGCMYDIVDDGSTEDDFFDPLDPDRRHGPSSTCAPGQIYANLGETSEGFNPFNLGLADGPALAGDWGIGTWVESAFDLSRFRGRSVRVRFLASVLKYPPFPDTWEGFFIWNPMPGDDGWWIDDVTVSGALGTRATATSDLTDNSSLPGAPGGDSDTDGVNDVCDNCAGNPNPDQIDTDDDGVGDVCDECPLDPFLEDHDDDGVCASDNCPFDFNPSQLDGDLDGFGAVCDCDDTSGATFPGAVEINDGLDNDCDGIADEMSGNAGFLDAGDKTRYSWIAQAGAFSYQVARADSPDFTAGCIAFPNTMQTFVVDADEPNVDAVYYYMVRPRFPNAGSWGQDSFEVERTVPCS